MTEERMICEKSHREINHPEHGEITEIWWCPVEPAPPKDWKPICFFGSEKCIFPTQIESRFDESCKHCPFKK